MKLSQDQINFIEDYLIKNKVTYWDVRMELLDHIATSVIEQMQHGVSFEHALEKEHLRFGNSLKSKKLSGDQRVWIFTESIYADNSGFKRLIQEKQLALSKGIRKELGQQLIQFFKTPATLIVYLGFLFILHQSQTWVSNERLVFKVFMIALLLVSCAPILIGLTQLKTSFRSLYLSSLATLPVFTISFYNLLLNLPKTFLEVDKYPNWYLMALGAVILPFAYTQIRLYFMKYRRFLKLRKAYFK